MFRKLLSLLGIPTPEERLARTKARLDALAAERSRQQQQQSRQQIEGLGYPIRYVRGADAQAELMAEREICRKEGFTPVIVLPDVRFHSDPTPEAVAEVLQEARDIDGAQWLKATLDRDLAHLAEMGDDAEEGELGSAIRQHLQELEPEGWEGARATRERSSEAYPQLGLLTERIQIDGTRTDRLVDQVAIVRFPTPHAYEAIAFLLWGGWNGVPQNPELVAILRHWQESFGAELAAVSSDVLELTVTRPPADRKAALRLLFEQYAFSSEIFEALEDPAAVEEIMTELLSEANWYFWWD
jgi:hypothetical protein